MQSANEKLPSVDSQCVFIGMSPVNPGSENDAKLVELPDTTTRIQAAPSKRLSLAITLPVGTVIVTGLFVALLFIYFGAAANPGGYTQNLEIAVMSFDSGTLHSAFMNFAMNFKGGSGLPAFKVFPNATSFEDMQSRVENGEFWGAILLQKGAEAKLGAAFLTANGSYDTSSAIQFLYDEGRFPMTVGFRVSGPGRAILGAFCQAFAPVFVKTMSKAYAAKVPAVAASAPKLLSKPLWFTEVKLRVADVEIATHGLTTGMVFLAAFAWTAWEIAYELTEPSSAPPTAKSAYTLLFVRLLILLWIDFCFGLSFTFVWQGLWGGFPSAGAWVGFWLLHWLHMFHYSMVFVAATNLLTLHKALRFAVVVIVLNITGSYNDLNLCSSFYQWGWAMPMTHAVMGSRTLVYEGRDQIGMNVGVLIAWTVAFLIVAIATVPRARPGAAKSAAPSPSPAFRA